MRNDINARSALPDGKRVVRLKSGDSKVGKIVIELVPGITAAQSAGLELRAAAR